MRRTIIIAQCTFLEKTSEYCKISFNKSLSELLPLDYVNVYNETFIIRGSHWDDIVYTAPQFAANLNIGEWYAIEIINPLFANLGWGAYEPPPLLTPEDYHEETLLLWQELGSLENPSIEEINTYIYVLNKR